MITGRKPTPTALRRLTGNPGKRGYNPSEPVPPEGLPLCPEHLSGAAQDEWDRLAGTLHRMGVLTEVDRAAFAAYCQVYGRWIEAEQRLRDLPPMVKTPSGYVQQNPWVGVANKQLDLMGRYMAEFGMTPAARSRLALPGNAHAPVDRIEITIVDRDDDGNRTGRRLETPRSAASREDDPRDFGVQVTLDERL